MPEVRLIDAIELVRYMCGACPSHQNGECIDKMCWKYEDRARIENAPTIEAEPVKHGRWIKEYQYLYGGEQWVNQYCSFCEIHTRQRVRDGLYKFCPNCGARMDGGADNGRTD